MIRIILAFAVFCLVGCVLGDDITELCKEKYASYKLTRKSTDYPTKYLLKYGPNIVKIREQAFMKNCRKIELHNQKEKKSFTRAINKFTDWTDEEFRSYLNLRQSNRTPQNIQNIKPPKSNRTNPIVRGSDFRRDGRVNSVRDQGRCGSCWAFAAVAAFEINYAKEHGKVEASEQWLVDCDERSYGCDGGECEYAYDMVKENGGRFAARNGYRHYSASQGYCKSPSSYVGSIDYYYECESESDMKSYADEYAMTVYVDANQWSSYGGGIYDDYCESRTNHAVVVIGYGEADGTDYWLIRNSWGEEWGEEGYIRLVRGQNQCSIAEKPLIPVPK